MRAVENGHVLLKLVVRLRVERVAYLRATTVERSQHLDRRGQTVGEVVGVRTEILKAHFIDDVRSDYRRLAGLHVLVIVLRVIPARDQVEAADAGILDIHVRIPVAEGKRVVRRELIIHARAHADTTLWHAENIRERIADERSGIERNGIDDGAVIHRVAADVQKKRRTLVDGPAQVAAILLKHERGFLRGVRIARVPDIVGEIVEARTVKLVRARLGENLDAAVAELVVFGRERILVDADLADGILGGKLAAAEAIDID